MTDEKMIEKSSKYAKSSRFLRDLVLRLVNHLEATDGDTFVETTNGHLQFPNGYLLIEIRCRVERMVLDLYSDPRSYQGLGVDELMQIPRRSTTRLAVACEADLNLVLKAVGHARKLKNEKLKKSEERRKVRAQ